VPHGEKCHITYVVGLPLGPMGATSRIFRLVDHMPHVIVYMSCYPVTCYMHVHVILSCNMLHALLLLLIHCIFYLW